jgi:cysteinyl-tRNA synthetase
MLSTHYRSPLNFSNDAIEQAQHALERVENCVANLKHRMQVMSSETSGTFSSNVANGSSSRKDSVGGMGRIVDSDIRFAGSQLSNEIKSIFDEYQSKMDDDFNTPDAITAVFDLVSAANSYIIQPIVDPTTLLHLLSAFEELNDVLRIIAPQGEELIEEDIERLILERIEARKSKMWIRADEIRDLLHSKGIVLEDTPQGIRWRRK